MAQQSLPVSPQMLERQCVVRLATPHSRALSQSSAGAGGAGGGDATAGAHRQTQSYHMLAQVTPPDPVFQ